jgi:hypothetical protein
MPIRAALGILAAARLAGRLAAGAAAGVVATTAMSAVLGALHRAGTIDRQPPQLIVDTVLPHLPEDKNRVLAAVAHFGYGTSAAAAYAAAVPVAARGATSGALYGLLVWLCGYEGWLPLLRVMPPAHRDDPNRVGTMVAAHVVFGSVLGGVLRNIARRARRRHSPSRPTR